MSVFHLLGRLLGVLVLFVVVPVSAQDVQVPFDPDSTLYTLGPELRDDLGLVPEVSGFQGAELYRLEEAGYELVIRYQPNGAVRRQRRPLTTEEVDTLRARIAAVREAAAGTPGFTQEGRYGLIASTTVLGLGEGGLLVGATRARGGAAAALPFFGGAAGFFVPFFVTRDARVTEPEADMAFGGGVQGYLHAVSLTYLLDPDPSDQAVSGAAALLGAAEATGGYLIARRNDWKGGHAEMVSFNGLGGTAIGYGIGTAIAGDAGIDEPRVVAATSVLGSLGGLSLGHWMGRTGRYTQGDARVYLLTGMQATNLVGSFMAAADVEDEQTIAGVLAGTGVGGLALGRWLVQNRNFGKDQGNLIALGGSAGSLFGVGLAAIFEMEGDGYTILQALGSATGFGVTYGVFAGEAQRTRTSGLDVDVRVAPSTARVPRPTGGSVALSDEVVPKLSLTMRF